MFAERLKKLRTEKGKSQREVAEVLGLETSSYGKYEVSGVMPPADKLEILADYFDVSIDYLLGRTDYKNYDLPDDVITVALHRADGELNEEGKEELLKYIDYLRERYKKDS